MPTYNYICNDCGYEWEICLPIDNRNDPVNSPCPECLKDDSVNKMISSALMIDPILVNGNKKFNKGVYEKLQQIDKITPGGIRNWTFR